MTSRSLFAFHRSPLQQVETLLCIFGSKQRQVQIGGRDRDDDDDRGAAAVQYTVVLHYNAQHGREGGNKWSREREKDN